MSELYFAGDRPDSELQAIYMDGNHDPNKDYSEITANVTFVRDELPPARFSAPLAEVVQLKLPDTPAKSLAV